MATSQILHEHERGGGLGVVGFGLLLAAAGVSLALLPRRSRHNFRPVRDSGPANMADPPSDWDGIDEALDQSFPASDPPGH